MDKLDCLKKGSRDFKNSFYFGIEYVPSMPGTHQKLCLVFTSFRSRSKQCDFLMGFFWRQKRKISQTAKHLHFLEFMFDNTYLCISQPYIPFQILGYSFVKKKFKVAFFYYILCNFITKLKTNKEYVLAKV